MVTVPSMSEATTLSVCSHKYSEHLSWWTVFTVINAVSQNISIGPQQVLDRRLEQFIFRCQRKAILSLRQHVALYFLEVNGWVLHLNEL